MKWVIKRKGCKWKNKESNISTDHTPKEGQGFALQWESCRYILVNSIYLWATRNLAGGVYLTGLSLVPVIGRSPVWGPASAVVVTCMHISCVSWRDTETWIISCKSGTSQGLWYIRCLDVVSTYWEWSKERKTMNCQLCVGWPGSIDVGCEWKLYKPKKSLFGTNGR